MGHRVNGVGPKEQGVGRKGHRAEKAEGERQETRLNKLRYRKELAERRDRSNPMIA